MGCLHDPANVQQTSSKCIQNTRANAGRLLDRVNTLLDVIARSIQPGASIPLSSWSKFPSNSKIRRRRRKRGVAGVEG